MAERPSTKTALRKRYETSRDLGLAEQLRECVEYLGNPEILIAEFSDSFLTADAFDNRKEDFCAYGQTQIPKRRWVDRIVQLMIDHEYIRLAAEPESQFRYLAREIIPLWSSDAQRSEEGSERRAAGGGIDYVGVIEESENPTAVLGVVQPREDKTPYLSLLRLLTCLAEVSTEPQMERANRFLFKGCLPDTPTFDLHILQVGADSDEAAALSELTKDLAHGFSRLLKEEWQFPNLLRNIECVRINPHAFEGELKLVWRV